MSTPPRILVTGASGLIGRTLVPRLLQEGMEVRAMVRSADRAPAGSRPVVGDLRGPLPARQELAGIDGVVHLAGRVHVMRETAADPLAEFRALNRDATLALARRAREAGASRFVFVSSIKVNGEGTVGRPFTASDAPAPRDPYAVSKWEAEAGLRDLERETGLDVVVLRPPLVHGPGVGGNLLRLMGLVARGIPLPFGAVRNARRLVGVANLADLIAVVLTHPGAAGGTFLAGDRENPSTPDLLRAIGAALGRPVALFPVPPGLLRLGATLAGRGGEIERLLGSLEFDISDLSTRLGWQPPVPLEEGLRAMVRAWRGPR